MSLPLLNGMQMKRSFIYLMIYSRRVWIMMIKMTSIYIAARIL